MALWAEAASGTGSGLRGAIWTDHEIKALIAVWGEGNVQDELDGAVRNKVVYERIAHKLQEHGQYHRDWKQCRDKIKNLKTKYKEIKDNNGETGRGRKSCKSFDEMDRILGHRPTSVLPVLFELSLPGPSGAAAQPQADSEVDEGKQLLLNCHALY